MIIDEIILKIRRHETPFYALLYKCYKKVIGYEVPCIKPIHGFLFHERQIRRSIWFWIGLKLYYEPLFKSQCVRVGKNFRIVRGIMQGIPYLSGKVYIEIGDNVILHSVTTIAGNKVYDRPILKVGNNTYIGSRVGFNVAQEISIGDYCYLADNITIRDNDGHPLDHKLRNQNQPVDKKDVKPVIIGSNVWIGSGCIIHKGITIGDGAIIGSGSVVINDVDPSTIVAGNPAKVIKRLS